MWTRNIDMDGLHKSAGKVEAVLKAPRPNDVAEVRLFLVLTNYYNGFMPNLSTVVHPLTKSKNGQNGARQHSTK